MTMSLSTKKSKAFPAEVGRKVPEQASVVYSWVATGFPPVSKRDENREQFKRKETHNRLDHWGSICGMW